MSLSSQTERQEPFRAVLGFTFSHWGRQRRRVAGVVFTVMAATAADLFMPLYAGRLVDAVAGERFEQARGRARGACHDDRARRRHGVLPAPVLHRHHADDAAHHERRGARGLRAPAALLDRLARQQLRRLDRAQDHPRHVGARPAHRHDRDRAAAVAGRAARHHGAAGLALAGDGSGRARRGGDLLRRHDRAVARLCRAGGAARQQLGHEARRRAGGRDLVQSGGQGLWRRGARGCPSLRRTAEMGGADAAHGSAAPSPARRSSSCCLACAPRWSAW